MDGILNDLKFASRQLLRYPGYSGLVTLTLALGIGATVVVFSIVKGVLLEPLDYPGYERIVHVWEADPKHNVFQRNTSPANFLDWREQNTVFEEIAFTAEYGGMVTRSFILSEGGVSQDLRGRFVPTGYFAVYGLQPMLGRSFLPEEEAPGQPHTVVISHRLWQDRFNSDPNILGRTMMLENNSKRNAYEIVGVMPPGFREMRSDVWVPCGHMPHPMTVRPGVFLHVVGRIKPGISLEQAQVEMSTIQAGLKEEYGASVINHSEMGSEIRLTPLLRQMVGHTRSSLFIFSGAVALVLLIACANVANILLTRNVARQGEISLRVSLGANRWRIVRLLLCESLLLSFIGGIGGVLLAAWGTEVIINLGANSIPRLETVEIDRGVIFFALAVSALTGLLFGLTPAWRSSTTDLNASLKTGTAQASASRKDGRLRGGFTVAQVALALILLIGAGLLLRTFDALQSVETGFDTEELLTVEFTMTGSSYEGMEDRRRFLRLLTERLRDLPGVEAACAANMIPDRGRGWPTRYNRVETARGPEVEWPIVSVRAVTPEYAKSYGIQLVSGREFTRQDTTESPRVIMINQTFADEVFPNENPVGQQLLLGGPVEIVGVIGDVKNSGLRGDTRPEVYACYEQWQFQSMIIAVRAPHQPRSLIPAVTQAFNDLNPEQPLGGFRLMQDYIDFATAQPRFRSMLIGMFGLMALLLASIGIYGVIAYSVSQRKREMGIRLALGAQKRDLIRLILGQGFKLTLIGIGVGLLGSFFLNRTLESLLFGVTGYDPTTFLSVPLLLALVALAACFIPACFAARVNPVEAIRND